GGGGPSYTHILSQTLASSPTGIRAKMHRRLFNQKERTHSSFSELVELDGHSRSRSPPTRRPAPWPAYRPRRQRSARMTSPAASVGDGGRRRPHQKVSRTLPKYYKEGS